MDILIGDWTKLGATVRDARTAHGFTQHELAERAGVSRSWLARLEGGHRSAELEQILRLLDALGMSMLVRDPNRADPSGGATPAPSPQLQAVTEWAREQRARRQDSREKSPNGWDLPPKRGVPSLPRAVGHDEETE